ncbi:MAG: Ig-like domain-containing protein, partial [Micrococcales bacterium]|nr:Ig-like domain-containing protein [Micrococcales bacterium]
DPDIVQASNAAGYFTTALSADGGVYAWGRNNSGQLGNDTQGTTAQSFPVPGRVGGLLADKDVIQVSSGQNHTEAVTSDGGLYAWGNGGAGQLGVSGNINRLTPVQITGFPAGTTVTQVAASSNFTVALLSDGTVWGWGQNTSGQLGSGTTGGVAKPYLPVRGLLTGVDVVQIAAGTSHTVALASDGTMYAWGLNSPGQLGDGTTTNSTLPVEVTALPAGVDVVQIAAGGNNTMALASDGTVYAWGANNVGQLGDGTTTSSLAAVAVGGALAGKDIVKIATGGGTAAAITSDGTLYLWGWNSYGQIGDGTTTNAPSPVQVTGLPKIADVSVDQYDTVAVAADGTVYAWGWNYRGELGVTGTLESVSFDGQAAVSESLADGVITATSPAHAAGAVDVEAELGTQDRPSPAPPGRIAWGDCTLTAAGGFRYLGPPQAPDESVTVSEGGSVTLDPATTQGTIATATVDKPPAAGTVTINANKSLTYHAGVAGPGVYTFQATYTDNVGQTVTADYTITVVEVPAEAASVPGRGTIEFGPVTTLGTITDVKVSSPPAAGTVTVNPDGSLTYQPGDAAPGIYTFKATYTNTAGHSTTITYTVSVLAVGTDSAAVPEGGSVIFTPPDSSGTITDTTVSDPPAAGTVTVNPDGSVSYDPGDAAPGTYTFEVIYTDENGRTTTVTYTVTVVEGPAEMASVPSSGAIEFGPVTALGTVTDVTVSSAPAAGTVTVNADGSLTYHPGNAAPGIYSFQVTYVNDKGHATTITYVVTVLAPEKTEAAVPQEGEVDFTPPPGETTTGGGTGGTNGGTTTGGTVSKPPAAGTVVINPDGTISYLPGDAAPGTYTFDVTYTDQNGQTHTITYTVDVLPGPAVPEQTPIPAVRATAAATVIGTASGVKAAGVKHGASIMTGGLVLTDQLTVLGRWSIPGAGILLAGGLAYLITTTRRRQHHHT